MRRFEPSEIYRGEPCSVVAVGCALGIGSRSELRGLTPPGLHSDGYLSLDGMNAFIRANMAVKKRLKFRRGERPCLRDFCQGFTGKAIVCVLGHFVYVEGGDYYSFFHNGGDEVISVWEVA